MSNELPIGVTPDGQIVLATPDVQGEVMRTFDQKFPTPDAPFGWIQWKGTSVCMDVHCACGYHGHVDADFAYNVKCGKCGRVYACDGHIRLVELNAAETADEKCVELAT